MRITFMGREEAGKFAVEDGPYVVISITDPDAPLAILREHWNREAVLRLSFWDFDDRLSEADAAAAGITLFTPEMAGEITMFVAASLDRGAAVVVHCEAGISRSAGVAAALAKHFNGDDEWCFRRGIPNRRVYRLLLNALAGVSSSAG